MDLYQASYKKFGTNQGVANSQLGDTYIHSMHAGGRFGTSVERLGGQVCQGQLSLPSFRGRYMGRGNFRLARGELPSLTKGLKLGSYRSGPGGYYGGTLVTVVTAVLKAVLSQGGHTAATKLLHDSIGISQVAR